MVMAINPSDRSQPLLSPRTTRGTPRQRAPKGYWAGVRYEVLATKPPDLIERMMQSKLRLMSPANRARVQTLLDRLAGEDRREFALRLLSGEPYRGA